MRVIGLRYKSGKVNHHPDLLVSIPLPPFSTQCSFSRTSRSIRSTHRGSYRKYPHIPNASDSVAQPEKRSVDAYRRWWWYRRDPKNLRIPPSAHAAREAAIEIRALQALSLVGRLASRLGTDEEV